MKDGWSYCIAVGGAAAAAPSVRWQFPNTGFPFTSGDGTSHADTRYLRPGAAWNNVFVTMNGGENVVSDVEAGYNRLHALNICSGTGDRVRWWLTVPSSTSGGDDSRYRIGPPTVTKGLVYVGTREGHLIVIADPSAWPSVGVQCSNPDVSTGDCASMGYQIVPIPAVLLNLALPTSNSIATEPVLANGKVFVANTGGTLYMLAPK
jgi:hypothetical protein